MVSTMERNEETSEPSGIASVLVAGIAVVAGTVAVVGDDVVVQAATNAAKRIHGLRRIALPPLSCFASPILVAD